MNNFPAMTEEQRQKMISDCQAEIVEIEKALTTWGEGWISYLQSKLTRQKIALAALTAEPEVWIKPDSLGFPRLAGIDAVTIPCVPEYPIPLYTAPPAPVLRLPDEADSSNLPFSAMAWNACLAEVKRLNNPPPQPEADDAPNS